jgi:hypothetical protein
MQRSVSQVDCLVNGKSVTMLIDSGADINAISEDMWLEIVDEWIAGKVELRDVAWGN